MKAAEWTTALLREVASKIGTGATPRGGSDEYKPTGIPLIRSLNVYDDGFREEGLAYLDAEQAARLDHVIVQEGDVLLNITGASIARCCVSPVSLLPARVNQHVAIIRPRPEILYHRFLHYLLIAGDCKRRLLVTGEDGGTTRQAITKAQLQNFRISFPPLPEQRRIVALLDDALDCVAAAKANAGKSILSAASVFEVELESTFDMDDGEPCSLADACSIDSSLVDPREPHHQQRLHVGGANMVSGTGELIDLQTAKKERLISGKFLFGEDVVLYSKIRPYLRKVARPDFGGLCSADVYPLTPKAGTLHRDYLYYLLLSPQFTAYAVGGSARAGMPKVNRPHLFAYRFPLPDINTQRHRANRLDAIGESSRLAVEIAKKKLKAFDELRASLLHQAFTGKL